MYLYIETIFKKRHLTRLFGVFGTWGRVLSFIWKKGEMNTKWVWGGVSLARVSHVSRETWFSLWFTVLLIECLCWYIYLNIINICFGKFIKVLVIDEKSYVSRETYVLWFLIVVCIFWEFMWILGKVIYVLFKYIKGEMFS